MNKNLPLVGFILSALAGIAVLALLMPSMNDGEMVSLSTEQIDYPAQAIQFQTTPSELVKAYRSSIDVADRRFKGQTFQVVGAIDYIGSDGADDTYIVMRAGIPFQNPKFYVGASEKSGTFWLGKGMYVSLICVGDGAEAGVPISRSCVIGK